MTAALRRFLPEFDDPPAVRSAPPAWRLLERAPPLPEPLAAEPESSAVLAEPQPDLVGEAVAAALAEAETRHAADLAEAGRRAATDLADARARWAKEQGDVLAARLDAGVAGAADGIAEAAAALLEPFLADAVRRAAVDELRQAVADLVAAGAGGRIAVSGPPDLVDALAEALARGGIAPERLDLAPSDAAEVVITADSSLVRTRLADWMQALRRRLERDA